MLGGTNRSGADSVDYLGRLHVGHAALAVHAAPNTRQVLVRRYLRTASGSHAMHNSQWRGRFADTWHIDASGRLPEAPRMLCMILNRP